MQSFTLTLLLLSLTIAIVMAKFTIKSQDELFFYTDERLRDRQASKSSCTGLGGHLMSIQSPGEAEFVRKFTLPASSECIWLGAKLKNNSYKWCDGSNSKYLDIGNNWSNNRCNSDCCAVCLDNRSKLRSVPCITEQRHVCQLNISCSETRDKILANWNDFTAADQSFLSVMFVTRNLQMTSHLKSSLNHVHTEDNLKQEAPVAEPEVTPAPAAATPAIPVENPTHHEHHDAAFNRLDSSDARVNAIANEVTQIKLDIGSLKEEISKLRQEVARDGNLFKAFLLREKNVVETRRDSLSQHLSSLDPDEQSDAPAAAPVAPAPAPITEAPAVTSPATESAPAAVTDGATTTPPSPPTTTPSETPSSATTGEKVTPAATTVAVTTELPVSSTIPPQTTTESASTAAATSSSTESTTPVAATESTVASVTPDATTAAAATPALTATEVAATISPPKNGSNATEIPMSP